MTVRAAASSHVQTGSGFKPAFGWHALVWRPERPAELRRERWQQACELHGSTSAGLTPTPSSGATGRDLKNSTIGRETINGRDRRIQTAIRTKK